MKKFLKKDIAKRIKFQVFEIKFLVIKTLLKSSFLPLFKRRHLRRMLTCTCLVDVRSGWTTRNGCRSGWNGGIFNTWAFSRFELKRYAKLGLLPGFIKRGW